MYPVLLFICFLLGRMLLLCSRYFLDSPFGGPLVQDWDRFLPFHIVADIGVFAVICFIFTIIRAPKVAACFLMFYMFLMGADDECARWMGSRFPLQFIFIYILNLNTDLTLIGKIFMDGIVHFCLTIGIILVTTISYIVIYAKFFKLKDINVRYARPKILLIVFAVLAITGLTSGNWLHPSERRLYVIRPVGVNWMNEIYGNFFNATKPENYEKGIKLLGGNPENKYPFWHEADDSLAYSNFKKLPLEQKPNIIIFTIETMRGWYMDIRDPAVCLNIPNLCEFSKKGMFFPEVHSVGFASIEGTIGINLGIYSHPSKVLLYNKYKKTLSLPEILGKAGYYKAIFTACDPSFDNLTHHYKDWYDYVEYDPKNNEDVPLASRVTQWLKEYDKSEPLLLNYVSVSSHIPFDLSRYSDSTIERRQYVDPQMLLPKKASENLQERYRQILRYVDSAIGILLKAVENTERENIIIIVSDHAIPEGYAGTRGPIDRSYTHIPIFISGNSIPKDSVDSRIVSQSSIAPTILDILNLNVSNHFVSKSLLQDSTQTVFAFRDGNYAVYNTELDSTDANAAMKSWGYVLDKNLLMP